MRPAPALSVPLHRSPTWRLAAVFISGSAFGLLAWWAARHWPDDGTGARGLRALAVLAVVIVGARAWHVLRPVPGTLRWDGSDWWLDRPDAAAQAGRLHLRLDLQRALLLEFVPQIAAGSPGEPVWLWLAQGMPGLPWHALRCAVYSPRPESHPASPVAPADGRNAANPPPDEHRP